MRRLVFFAVLLSGLTGCQFARMRYHGASEHSDALACIRSDKDPNGFDCFDYFSTQIRPVGPTAPKDQEQRL